MLGRVLIAFLLLKYLHRGISIAVLYQKQHHIKRGIEAPAFCRGCGETTGKRDARPFCYLHLRMRIQASSSRAIKDGLRLNGGGLYQNPWEKEKVLPDYYALLGVNPGVSAQELRKAHKQMMLKYHPDKNAGSKLAQERFVRVQVCESCVLVSNDVYQEQCWNMAGRKKVDADRVIEIVALKFLSI